MADALAAAGRRAHAPYSRCPAAIVLELVDDGLVAGATIESVAFDPTIGTLQAEIVELIARGHAYAAIRSATLATMAGGAADPVAGTRALLEAIAPDVPLTETTWS